MTQSRPAERIGHACASVLILLLATTTSSSVRADGAKPPPVSEQVLSHRRVAAAYLRTGNADLALMEIEALEEKLDGSARSLATAARVAAEAGDLAAAAVELARLRDHLASERRSRGVRAMADCITEAEIRLAAIEPGREAWPDISSSAARDALRQRAALALGSLARCDDEAAGTIAAQPEFRRLVDGATASLRLLPQALDRGDSDLLHRLLIELRSFERLLVQRFG